MLQARRVAPLMPPQPSFQQPVAPPRSSASPLGPLLRRCSLFLRSGGGRPGAALGRPLRRAFMAALGQVLTRKAAVTETQLWQSGLIRGATRLRAVGSTAQLPSLPL